MNILVCILIKMLDICTTTTNHNKTWRLWLESQLVFFSFSLRERHLRVNDCQPSWWRALIPRSLISAIKAAYTSYFHSCVCLYLSVSRRHADMPTVCLLYVATRIVFLWSQKNLDGEMRSKSPLDLGGRLRIMRTVWAENWIFILFNAFQSFLWDLTELCTWLKKHKNWFFCCTFRICMYRGTHREMLLLYINEKLQTQS